MYALLIVLSTISAKPQSYAERVLIELYWRDRELAESPDPDYHPPRNVRRMTPSKTRIEYSPRIYPAPHYDLQPVPVWTYPVPGYYNPPAWNRPLQLQGGWYR